MGKVSFFMSLSFYLWSFATTPFVFFCMKKAHHCDVLRVLYVFDYYLGTPLLNLILQQIDLDTF